MIVDTILEEKVCNICIRFNVVTAFNYVKEKNPSNNLPYHNWYHICCMVEKVVEGANYHTLPYRSIRHLIVAALFHDFAHTGGKHNDATNIQLAVLGLYALGDVSTGRTVAPDIDMVEVEEIIRVTEYPYVLDPVCIEQKIIRDADLMQAFRPTWKEMVIDGLREEMSIRLGKELTLEDMYEGQEKFLKFIHSQSGWGDYVMRKCGNLDKALDNLMQLRVKNEHI